MSFVRGRQYYKIHKRVFMLTKEAIEQFHRNGFLIVKGVFKGRELELLQEATQRVIDDGVSGSGDSYHRYHEKPDGSKIYYRSELMFERDPIFPAVTVKPALLEMFGQLLGHSFVPMSDAFVCKLPNGDVPVPWHQDPPYEQKHWDVTFGVPNIDLDIYLDHSTIDNGCLWAIPGHHLVGNVEMEKYSEEELFRNFGAVPVELEPGDINFHCLSVPHGSRGNKTDTLRRTFYVHYLNEAVFEKCYRQYEWVQSMWIDNRGEIFEDVEEKMNRMIENRKSFGFIDLHSPDIKLTAKGFEFVGEPGTEPLYWNKLIAALSSDEIARRKRLDPVRVDF